MPVSIVVKHGVENHEEFAHAGGERRFRIFPARTQLGVKILDDWIGANRGDNGHIQDAPDLGAPAPDTAASVQASAVTVKWRQSGQRGDLFAIKCSQLGQVCEQSTREARATGQTGSISGRNRAPTLRGRRLSDGPLRLRR